MPPKEPSSTDDPDASKAASSHWSGPFGLPPFSELIPLGYLYLLLLGLSSESIHYGMLGVNVLDYSDALDVLLSPIALMTDSLAVLAVVVGVPIFFVPYMQFARWLAHRRPTEKNRRFRERPLGELWLSACIAALFFAFLGLGLGQGIKHARGPARRCDDARQPPHVHGWHGHRRRRGGDQFRLCLLRSRRRHRSHDLAHRGQSPLSARAVEGRLSRLRTGGRVPERSHRYLTTQGK
jgi:hypothetical protein